MSKITKNIVNYSNFLQKNESWLHTMKTSTKGLLNTTTQKQMDGMNFKDPSLYDEANFLTELALDFGVNEHDILKVKKQIERS